ncbi:hypothetical protein AMS68_003077 [Peltaster fructicola]|uniref:Arylsulfotransferase N-terminal domain-containing protein n=1 Tax=Peltaster fructicola TaxID=286661 RepID=A0A6H0XSX4_9PEZI|nr:hypothetical protein AMS68_003077 [Peltaster fructicola]
MSTYTSLALLCALSRFSSIVNASPFPGHQQDVCALDSYTLVPDNGTGLWPYRTYKTNHAEPPQLAITKHNSTTKHELSPGLIFFGLGNAYVPGEARQAPLIMTSDGDLVWSGPESATSNVQVHTLHGRPVLSYWVEEAGTAGYGSVRVMDTQYNILHTVCPKIDIQQKPGSNATCVADTHEATISANNTMILPVYNLTQTDLTSLGGPKDGWVIDPLAVEVDIETNEVLWSWSPLAHVPVNVSGQPLQGTGYNASHPFDWFHTNSIQPFNDNFLINSRSASTAYYVNRSGEIMWEINGRTGGSFGPLSKETAFSWQHHVRLHSLGDDSKSLLLTMFDDSNQLYTQTNTSSALGIVLELPPNKATSPRPYSRLIDTSELIASYAQGSYELLPGGNAFVGFGARPFMKEFGPNKNGSEVLWSAQFGYDNNNNTAVSYRAFKNDWHATPSEPVDVVVHMAAPQDELNYCANGSQYRGYVSWHGATDIVAYSIHTGQSETCLDQVSTIPRLGFETEFVVPVNARFLQVMALKGARHAVGNSSIVAIA